MQPIRCHPVSLVHLPDKILLKIKNHLSRESQAALALTSRRLLQTMGAHTLSLNSAQRDGFLRLLHRDLTTDIYCVPCGKLHDPVDYDDRNCPHVRPINDYMRPTHAFPVHYDFAVVRAAARDIRASRCPMAAFNRWGAKFRERRSQKTFDGIKSSGTWEDPVFGFNSTTQCLMLKYQFSWIPDAAQSAVTTRNVRDIELIHSQMPEICLHRRWREEYPFVFPRGVERKGWEMDPKLDCALHHPWNCTCTGAWAGKVRGCTECHTDYCLALAPVSITGLLVFTIWKNFGHGGEFPDPYYKSHEELDSACPSSAPPGSQCIASEKRWFGDEPGVFIPYHHHKTNCWEKYETNCWEKYRVYGSRP